MTLIAVHFPKAGGTALGIALQQAFGAALLADYAEDPALPESPRNIDPIGYFRRRPNTPDGTRCVYGHFHPNKYRLVPGAKRFVLLRDPIDTMISIYFYFQSAAPMAASTYRYVMENRLSLLEMARLPLFTRLMSQTYFDGVDMGSFDLIGRHDRRDESLKRLSALCGVEIAADVRANVTPPDERRAEIESDTSVRAQLAEILRDDLRFYERHAFRDV